MPLCLLMNEEREKIHNYFYNFSPRFIQIPIKRIGAVSGNGFIHHIHYRRKGYDAYAVMKSAVSADADNLIYEYLVGIRLNKYRSIFPNLVETYGVYHYNSEKVHTNARKMKLIDTEDVKNEYLKSLTRIDHKRMSLKKLLTFSCANSMYIATLIENVENPMTIEQLLEGSILADDFLCILFQVYFLLHSLREKFTHYDLHEKNVLIIDFGGENEDKYIEYVYHIKDEKLGKIEIAMKSRYLAKIIDYGRSCVFPESKKIHDELCTIGTCKANKYDPTDCGNVYGYFWLSEVGSDRERHYIRSTRINNSHDLKLLTKIHFSSFHSEKQPELYSDVYDFLSKVHYEREHGTPDKLRKSGEPDMIYNVSDAFRKLADIISGFDYISYNSENYKDTHRVGTLDIYSDGRPFVFEMTQ